MFLFSVDKVICNTSTLFRPMKLCFHNSIIGVHANSSRPSTPLFEKFLEVAACSSMPLDFGQLLYSKTNVCDFEFHGCQWQIQLAIISIIY